MPDWSRDALVRELDFYQLPSMSELGISLLDRDKYPTETAYKLCGNLLAEELSRRDLWKSLPLYVWFYKEVEDGSHGLSTDKVFVAHKWEPCWHSGTPKEQSTFSAAVTRISMSQNGSCWETLESNCGKHHFVVRNVANPQVYGMLQRAALEYGLRLERPTHVAPFKGVLVIQPNDAGDRETS